MIKSERSTLETVRAATPSRGAPPKPPRGPRGKGLIKAMFSMDPRQLEALRREALKRAAQDPDVKAGRKSLRAAVDASALVRAAVASWLARMEATRSTR
jgi:hypothetical protein